MRYYEPCDILTHFSIGLLKHSSKLEVTYFPLLA
ncbi:mCG147281 [Mus musculus]|nr:mCG147281 [Mus musculus]